MKNKMTFNLEFMSNIDDLAKRMQTSFNNVKLSFDINPNNMM